MNMLQLKLSCLCLFNVFSYSIICWFYAVFLLPGAFVCGASVGSIPTDTLNVYETILCEISRSLNFLFDVLPED